MNAVLMMRGGSQSSSSRARAQQSLRGEHAVAHVDERVGVDRAQVTEIARRGRSGDCDTVSTAAIERPWRRHSWRKYRKYSSPFGEISLSTATRVVTLALEPGDDEGGVTAAVAVAEPEAVLALESVGAAPADERDPELVGERARR